MIRVATVKAFNVVFSQADGGESDAAFINRLKTLGKEPGTNPATQKYINKIIDFFGGKKQPNKPEIQSYGGGEVPLDIKDFTAQAFTLVRKINEHKPFIQDSANLTKEMSDSQVKLNKEWARATEIVKELRTYVKDRAVILTDESRRLFDSLSEAYWNMKVLIYRIQESLDKRYDKLNEFEVQWERGKTPKGL